MSQRRFARDLSCEGFSEGSVNQSALVFAASSSAGEGTMDLLLVDDGWVCMDFNKELQCHF